jgi:DNA-binding NtrC family response regulator
MKMLVVDDEPIVLESCRRILADMGFESVFTTSADQALRVIVKEKIELLLIDIKMPGHDGMYLMREVKDKWPHIPIIVMSGYATEETIAEVSAMDAASFITKPFTPDEMLDAVCRVVEREFCRDKEKNNKSNKR